MAKSKTSSVMKYKVLEKITSDVVSDCSEMRYMANQAKYEDKVFGFFAEEVYPYLAAVLCPRPGLDELYAYSPKALDKLFVDIRNKVHNWLDEKEFTEETIVFSDGRKIIIQSRRPSVSMRLVKSQQDAKNGEKLDNYWKEQFRSIRYPKLAGCSVGDVPDQVYTQSVMSYDDVLLWEAAAERQNPEWYTTEEELAAQNQAQEKEKKSQEEPPA